VPRAPGRRDRAVHRDLSLAALLRLDMRAATIVSIRLAQVSESEAPAVSAVVLYVLLLTTVLSM
jgi:hypothetical protein